VLRECYPADKPRLTQAQITVRNEINGLLPVSKTQS